uniref:Uncharacterized protein n=1 Tax=Anopheles melas TaxID=34690 RepID=A0A182ULF1_9DIPT
MKSRVSHFGQGGCTALSVVVSTTATSVQLVPAGGRFRARVMQRRRFPVAYGWAPLDRIAQGRHLRRRDRLVAPANPAAALVAALPLPAAHLRQPLAQLAPFVKVDVPVRQAATAGEGAISFELGAKRFAAAVC